MDTCTDHVFRCGACGDMNPVDDMATDALWTAEHMAALTARFGRVCGCCADEHAVCDDCGAVTALKDMDEDRCPDCLPHYLAQSAADAADVRFLSGRGYR